MLCGGMDDMKITIGLIFVLVFTAAVVYYLNEKIKYLEYAVSKQNQVLSEFISNVQKQVILGSGSGSLGSSDNSDNIKIIKNNGYEKIPVSDDEDDSDSDSEDDSDSDSDDDDSEEVSDNEEQGYNSEDKERKQNNENIKVIELINDIVEEVKEEVHNSASAAAAAAAAAAADTIISEETETSSKNIKKIELDDEGDIDIVGSKKMSVAELRALVVSKGLANTASANKMKKIELNDLLQKFSQ
jgi:cell division protein FtsL